MLKVLHATLIGLGLLLLAGRADAALYATTAAGAAGELYILNPGTGGVLQDVGPLNDQFGVNYGITGLAYNPVTGIMYGSTANNIAETAAKLVTIDLVTARVTVIGNFNAGNAGNPATMADLTYDPGTGGLYGIGSIGGPQLYSINPITGQATIIGNTGITSTTGGGLAVSPGGIFYGTPSASRYGTYDPLTGAYSNIANPAKPVGGAYASLDFDQSGVLYGIDLGAGSPPPTHLVTFDAATGVVTDIGASLNSIDAIGFVYPIPEPGAVALLVGSAVMGLFFRARRRN